MDGVDSMGSHLKHTAKIKVLFKSRFIRTIFLLSLAITIVFPLIDKLLIYPAFTRMLVDNTIEETKHLAFHISTMAGLGQMEFKRGSIPEEIAENIRAIEADSHFFKIKIYSSSGEVIHSSDPEDIGAFNTSPTFKKIVAQGNEYGKFVRNNNLTVEGRRVVADVVETYIPIMKAGRFIGAFEIYYNVTHKRDELDRLLSHSTTVLLLVSIGLLSAVIIVSYKGASAEEELQKAHRELEIRVAERTAELKAANEYLHKEIVEHLDTEEALKDSEEKFRSISASAKDAIIVTDGYGTVSYWNEAAEKIFGFAQEEVIGRPLHNLIVPEGLHERHLAGMLKFRQGDEGAVTGKTLDLMAKRKGGEEFPIELSFSSFKLKDEWHAVAMVRDITERKYMEQQLVRAEKLASLEVLSSGAAHEINNPLNVVTLNLQLLLKDKSLRGESRQVCEEVIEHVEYVREVLVGLDTFAQQLKAEKQEVDIQQELEQCVQSISDEAERCGIDVVWDASPTSVVVMGNPALLQSAFEKILDNAVRAMPRGGKLTIETETVTRDGAQWVKILIADTGLGIPQEHISKVFDPFFTLREVGKGRGLGLSIAQGVIEDHKGSISVESPDGLGAVFEIFLPTFNEGTNPVLWRSAGEPKNPHRRG